LHNIFAIFRHTAVTGAGLGRKQCRLGRARVGSVRGAG